MKSVLSPAALATAIEESYAEFNQVMGRSPLVERHDSEGRLFVVNHLNYRVIKVPGDGIVVGKVIARTRGTELTPYL